MVWRIFAKNRFFRFFGHEKGQLPNFPPRLRRCFGRFRAENKTQSLHQYCLPGFKSTGPGEDEKVSELGTTARNLKSRSGPVTFCILARMRRVLRTIEDSIQKKIEIFVFF